jgi:hypothetical protein
MAGCGKKLLTPRPAAWYNENRKPVFEEQKQMNKYRKEDMP